MTEAYADPERPCPECGCPAQSRQWDGRCDSCGDPEALKHQRRLERKAAIRKLWIETRERAERRRDLDSVRHWSKLLEMAE